MSNSSDTVRITRGAGGVYTVTRRDTGSGNFCDDTPDEQLNSFITTAMLRELGEREVFGEDEEDDKNNDDDEKILTIKQGREKLYDDNDDEDKDIKLKLLEKLIADSVYRNYLYNSCKPHSKTDFLDHLICCVYIEEEEENSDDDEDNDEEVVSKKKEQKEKIENTKSLEKLFVGSLHKKFCRTTDSSCSSESL